MFAELTTEDAFLDSILHDEHVILGRTMRPFCVEMWCLLRAAGSPLIDGGAITMADMQFAILACSTSSVSEFYAFTRRPTFTQKLWFILTQAKSVGETLARYNRYIEDYVPQFPRSENLDGGCAPEFKCPEVFLCVAQLIDRGHSPREIKREMGLGEVLSWGLAIRESNGDPLEGILNERQIDAARQIDAMLEGST